MTTPKIKGIKDNELNFRDDCDLNFRDNKLDNFRDKG